MQYRNDDTHLRPVAEQDLEVFELLDNGGPQVASIYGWFGWSDPVGRRRRWAENGLLTGDHGHLMVAGDRDVFGHVSWHGARQGPINRSWTMGIALLPEARGRGIGTRAHLLLARYLFAHTQANRIDASTDVTNIAERRALEKAGFTREGVMRGAQFRDGEYHDMALYSILRREVPLDES